MRIDDLRPLPLFDGLSDDQLQQLLAAGEEVRFERGMDMFVEGEHADFWWLLVDGALELRRHVGREDMVVGHMAVPGQWSGGFQAWDAGGVYLATGRGLDAGRLLRLPAMALRERTQAWFPFGGHLIQGLYGTARTIESTARQRESLVTLGTLAAGIAHEINNPAAAATRAVDALGGAAQDVFGALGQLAAQGISAEHFTALDDLRKQLAATSGPALDAVAVADLEDEITSWLSRRGVDRDWIIAPALAAVGADAAWCDRVAGVLPEAALAPGLEWAASTFAVTSLLAEVKDSTGRISELVAAVRSYSQMDRGSVQEIDVTEGIESTLVMLGHKLRDGVTVVRDYGADVPRIEAYPGELNQVWTNLIDNAIDAIHAAGARPADTTSARPTADAPPAGTIRVATRRTDDGVMVDICDDGAGMPPEVAARAFEAFYTTKEVGKGTGLGLDIARRIVVERHRGTIEIDSRPGRTVFHVGLPARLSRT